MQPAPVRYARPSSVREAVALLAEGDGRPLAGGQSLVGLLSLRRASPGLLVDLSAIAELHELTVDAQEATIGAMVTMQRAEADPALAVLAPLLGEALRHVASPAVRARGTVVGSLAHGDPVGEVPTALVALDASATIAGPGGLRRVAVSDLRAGGESLRPDELIVDVRISPGSPSGWAFDEVAPRRFARALVAAAGIAHGTRVRVVVAGVAAAPTALPECDANDPDLERTVSEAVAALAAEPDVRADERYRREAATALAVRVALAAAAAPERRTPGAAPSPPAPLPAPRPQTVAAPDEVELHVNGAAVRATVEPRTLLVDLLRDQLGLTATHIGCGHGVCGACNVLVDGSAVRSCLTLALQVEGRDVRTLEGLRADGELDALVPAFVEHHALQCGFCSPGFLVTAAERRARGLPLDADALAGNLCRCTGYGPILAALETAR
jgi:CO/xanthine dehydrogenase FAD-binding subunit/aerobic-type carbon monoxide dehydrogenase small subunit (CoxS/CutS family)